MSKVQREAYISGSFDGQARNLTPGEAVEMAKALFPDSPLGNVRECMVQLLKGNGYDGLYCLSVAGTIICDCSIMQDFMNCADGCLCDTCRPGVLVDGKIVEREG